MAALPDSLSEQPRRAAGQTEGTGPGAAYGDPPLVVRCGVDAPAGFDPRRAPGPKDPSPCIVVDDIGWYLPDDERDGSRDATFTAVSYAPLVSVEVPRTYLPEGSAAALAELAAAVSSTLSPAVRCA